MTCAHCDTSVVCREVLDKLVPGHGEDLVKLVLQLAGGGDDGGHGALGGHVGLALLLVLLAVGPPVLPGGNAGILSGDGKLDRAGQAEQVRELDVDEVVVAPVRDAGAVGLAGGSAESGDVDGIGAVVYYCVAVLCGF